MSFVWKYNRMFKEVLYNHIEYHLWYLYHCLSLSLYLFLSHSIYNTTPYLSFHRNFIRTHHGLQISCLDDLVFPLSTWRSVQYNSVRSLYAQYVPIVFTKIVPVSVLIKNNNNDIVRNRYCYLGSNSYPSPLQSSCKFVI